MNHDRISSPPRLAQTSDEMGGLFTSAESSYRRGLDESKAWHTLETRLGKSGVGPYANSVRWRKRAALLVFAAAASVLLTWFGWSQYRLQGGTFAFRAQGKAQPASTSLGNALIRLAPGKSQLPDGTSVELTDDAHGTLVADGHRSTLQFDHGQLNIHVAHQSPGHAFAVKTRDVEFVVLGTRFSVVTRETAVKLSVMEGRVLVKSATGAQTVVGAGEHWSNQSEPAKEPEPAPSTAPATKSENRPTQEVTTTSRITDVSICRDYVRDGKPRVAQNCYLDAAAGKGLSAEMALYEVARLRRDVLSNPSGSLSALDEYEKRFPSGTFAPEVRIARTELLSRLGRYDEALEASEQVLATPIGRSRAAELRLLRGNLLRDQKHDCAAAIAEYRQVESDPGARGDQAQFAKAGCLRRLGKNSEALETYTRYLQRPRPAHAESARQFIEELTQ